MALRTGLALAALGAFCMVASPRTASAAFVLIDDFETGYTVGAGINGINGWVAAADFKAVVDPAGAGNTVLQFTQNNQTRDAYKPLPVTIDNTSLGTLFARFRFDSDGRNGNFGLTNVDAPNDFAHYNAQLNIQPSQSLNARDGGSFEELRPLGSATAKAGSNATWYSIWLVVDNINDTFRVFIQSDGDTDFTTQTEVFGLGSNGDPLNFRTTTAQAIDRLFLRSATGPMYWDDFYIDNTSLNLGNPIPEPASLMVLAMGAGLILARRRA